jgi:ketosteroid isomerase-like protein
MTGEIEAEVARLFHDYVAAFNRDDLEACRQYFHAPCMLVSQRGVIAMPSPEAFLANWREVHDDLRRRGLASSQVTDVKTLVLSPAMAKAGVRYDRFDKDGGLWEQICGTYSVHKGDDGWKIVSFMMHPRETWLGTFVK